MEIATYLYFLLPTYSISCETVMDYVLTNRKHFTRFFGNQSFKNINFQTFEVLTVKLDTFEKKLTCKIRNCLLFVIPTIQNGVKLS